METNAAGTNTAMCPSCGGDNEKQALFCVLCRNPLPGRRRTSKKIRHIIFGAIGLILIGAMGLFWMGGCKSELVGKVNGEAITRKEFSKRVERAKKFYELNYGQSLFQGEEGKENLNRLKTDILDDIATEMILLQEAKRAGYSSAPEEEIRRQVQAVKEKHGFTDADLKQKMGGGIEDLKEELRKEWIISQFLEKVVQKGDQQNGELLLAQWFKQAKAKAKIETYEKLEPVLTAKTSCCRSGGRGSRTQKAQPLLREEDQKEGSKRQGYRLRMPYSSGHY
jgi:hypothetical protein